ncbi:recombinase RecQ, partial [Pseudomonas syringae]
RCAAERCRHCSVCLVGVAHLPDPPALKPLGTRDFQHLCSEFIRKHQDYIGQRPSADCLPRFLCGISVPLFTKLKARATTGFAVLEDYPYAQVRTRVQAMAGNCLHVQSDLTKGTMLCIQS